MMMSLMIPVSWGEFFDKVTILQIKQERITDPSKLVNIDRELTHLQRIYENQAEKRGAGEELTSLIAELKRTNEILWDVEDDIRTCEREQLFDALFISLARSVYRTNDHRAEVKYRINKLLGSELIEEKSYEAY